MIIINDDDCLKIDLPHVNTIFADPPDGVAWRYSSRSVRRNGYNWARLQAIGLRLHSD
jgi:hypothetical protein